MLNSLPTYRQLKGLGERFLGPVFAPAMAWMVDRISEDPAREVLFAAREGYFLKRLATEYRDLIGRRDGKRYQYLEVSRAILFRLVLDEETLLPAALQHGYQGRLDDILQHRFGLSPEEVETLGLRSRSSASFQLPNDCGIVADIILSSIKREQIERQRTLYKAYVQELAPGSGSFHLIDVGYAGTIQKLLGAITDRPSTGSYLIRTQAFDQPIVTNDKALRSVEGKGYWANDIKFGDGDPLLEFSLIIEAIFTSPNGQLRSIKPDIQTKRQFEYRAPVSSQDHFYLLAAIVDGISEYMRKYVALLETGAAPDEIINGRAAFDACARYDRSPEMLFLKQLLHIDDNISGLGVHAPFATFGIN